MDSEYICSNSGHQDEYQYCLTERDNRRLAYISDAACFNVAALMYHRILGGVGDLFYIFHVGDIAIMHLLIKG